MLFILMLRLNSEENIVGNSHYGSGEGSGAPVVLLSICTDGGSHCCSGFGRSARLRMVLDSLDHDAYWNVEQQNRLERDLRCVRDAPTAW